jgi:hypothetical protein
MICDKCNKDISCWDLHKITLPVTDGWTVCLDSAGEPIRVNQYWCEDCLGWDLTPKPAQAVLPEPGLNVTGQITVLLKEFQEAVRCHEISLCIGDEDRGLVLQRRVDSAELKLRTKIMEVIKNARVQ